MTDTLTEGGSVADATLPPVVESAQDSGASASAPSDSPTTTATTAEGAAAEAAGATPAQVAELEGRLNGQPYKVPLSLELPWKRGKEEGFVTLEEVQKAHMFERDYRVKTQQLSEQRSSVEQARIQLETMRRQMDVEREFIQKENQRLMDALTHPDPEVRERQARHIELLQTDSDYREAYEAKLRAGAYEAVEAFKTEQSEQQQAQAIIADIQDTAQQLANEFPGVDVQRAMARYGRALEEGRASLTVNALRSIFQDEHQYVQRSVAPVMSELEALKAEIAALKAGTKADAHNQQVRGTIAKQQAARAVAATGTGAPPNPAAATSTAARPRDRQAASTAWVNAA